MPVAARKFFNLSATSPQCNKFYEVTKLNTTIAIVCKYSAENYATIINPSTQFPRVSNF